MRKIFDRSIPRLLILLIDIAICFGSLFLAYLIRFNFEIPEVESSTFYYVFPFVVLSRTISFFVVRTYAGIIRYTNTRDAMRILLTMAVVSGIFVVSNGISYFTIGHYIVPFSIIIIEF